MIHSVKLRSLKAFEIQKAFSENRKLMNEQLEQFNSPRLSISAVSHPLVLRVLTIFIY